MATEIHPGLTRRLVRFGATGLLVTGLHVIIAFSMVQEGIAVALANGFAFAIATSVSYVVNTLWSFSTLIGWKTAARFLVVTLICCAAAVGISGGIDALGGSLALSIGGTVLVVPPLSFLLQNFWAYRLSETVTRQHQLGKEWTTKRRL